MLVIWFPLQVLPLKFLHFFFLTIIYTSCVSQAAKSWKQSQQEKRKPGKKKTWAMTGDQQNRKHRDEKAINREVNSMMSTTKVNNLTLLPKNTVTDYFFLETPSSETAQPY